MTTREPAIALIVAMAKNRVIGKNGDLPWHLPEDLRRFKALTLGHPCLMGRKTFESIVARLGKPLPGRTSIVVSRSGFEHPNVPVFNVPVFTDLGEALDAAKFIAVRDGKEAVFVIGGAEIYHQTLPLADRIFLTEIETITDGDAFFPDLPEKDWRAAAREDHPGPPPFSWKTLIRRG